MTTRRYFANNAPTQQISPGVNSAVTTVTAPSYVGWPSQYPFFATLDIGTASCEIVSVTNITGNNATVVRGQGGTAAVTHPAGATFDATFVAQDADEANAHTSASAGVHGLAGNVVGHSDVQSLSNKTLISPAITGTVANSATNNLTGAGTSLAVTNNETVGGTITITGISALNGGIDVGTFTNEAAVPSPTTSEVVYLTAPTGAVAVPGLFVYAGGVWNQLWGDTGWITATLGNSWVAFGAPYVAPQYRKFNGLVYISGEMKSGTTATTVFTLPVGYRPAQQHAFSTNSVSGTAAITILASGVVRVDAYNGGNNTSVSLDGCTFIAEA